MPLGLCAHADVLNLSDREPRWLDVLSFPPSTRGSWLHSAIKSTFRCEVAGNRPWETDSGDNESPPAPSTRSLRWFWHLPPLSSLLVIPNRTVSSVYTQGEVFSISFPTPVLSSSFSPCWGWGSHYPCKEDLLLSASSTSAPSSIWDAKAGNWLCYVCLWARLCARACARACISSSSLKHVCPDYKPMGSQSQRPGSSFPDSLALLLFEALIFSTVTVRSKLLKKTERLMGRQTVTDHFRTVTTEDNTRKDPESNQCRREGSFAPGRWVRYPVWSGPRQELKPPLHQASKVPGVYSTSYMSAGSGLLVLMFICEKATCECRPILLPGNCVSATVMAQVLVGPGCHCLGLCPLNKTHQSHQLHRTWQYFYSFASSRNLNCSKNLTNFNIVTALKSAFQVPNFKHNQVKIQDGHRSAYDHPRFIDNFIYLKYKSLVPESELPITSLICWCRWSINLQFYLLCKDLLSFKIKLVTFSSVPYKRSTRGYVLSFNGS